MRSRLRQLLKLFVFLLTIYALLRLGFLLTYYRNEGWGLKQVVKVFYWGMRLDFAALFYINIPFIVYWLFIDTLIQKEWSRRVGIVIFSLINLAFLALNFIDLVYFNFNNRRSTVDIIHVFGDSSSAFGEFFKAYGWVLLVFIVAAIVLVRRGNRVLRNVSKRSIKATDLILPLLLLTMAFGVARGFDARPIIPSTPILYFEPRFQPLINNSTFNFIYSAFRKQTRLERKSYFTEQQLDSLFTIRKQYQHDAPFQKKNVVIFVLESFSKEHFKGYQQEAYMPFFDSLMQHSTVCNNAFANALESNKGLPAILASLPEVTDEPIYLSNYSNVQFKGIGTILKEQGYNTSFFMGAEYDHFGFAKLCKMVGIDEYYSMNTYGKRKDQYDGTWGIYDEYFFPYFAEVISKKQQPFFSVLFNLSSHYPYKMPEATAKRITVAGQKVHQNGATYVDWCFSQLFQKIKAHPWYSNTLFVFVADHGFRYTTDKNEILKEIRIPLFIYDPQRQTYQPVNQVVKQLDIVPSILDQLNYSQGFMSFGSSLYRQPDGFSINKIFGLHQYIDSTALIGYDEKGDRFLYYYNYPQDSLLQNNLLTSKATEVQRKGSKLKAFIQRAQNSLTDNRLLVK